MDLVKGSNAGIVIGLSAMRQQSRFIEFLLGSFIAMILIRLVLSSIGKNIMNLQKEENLLFFLQAYLTFIVVG